MEQGLMALTTEIDVVRETASTALLDANDGWGQVASERTVELVVEKARKGDTSVDPTKVSSERLQKVLPDALATLHGVIERPRGSRPRRRRRVTRSRR